MGHALDTIAPIALAVIGDVVAGPWGGAAGAALGSGGVNYSQNHSLGRALEAGALSGGGTFLGSNIANAALGPSLGTVGSTINSALGSTGASSDIASALGSSVGSALKTPISNVIGSYAGNSLASSFQPPGANTGRGIYEPTYNTPGGTGGLPTSLNSMSSLTPQQQSSSLATQGAYGGGLGPQEQGYFKNLVNNEIVGGQSPNAIENTYLSNLGFGNEGSNYNLAKALSKWNPNA